MIRYKKYIKALKIVNTYHELLIKKNTISFNDLQERDKIKCIFVEKSALNCLTKGKVYTVLDPGRDRYNEDVRIKDDNGNVKIYSTWAIGRYFKIIVNVGIRQEKE